MRETKGPTFAGDGCHQADMLVRASNVTSFLTEMCPHFTGGGGYLGLSEEGGEGLSWIVSALGNTIDAALLLYEPKMEPARINSNQEAKP